MSKYILNKHVRYRQEEGYILVCDCKKLLDYEVPLEYFDLLSSLEKGCKSRRNEIIEELMKMGLVDEVGKEREELPEDIFSKLGYDESEFV